MEYILHEKEGCRRKASHPLRNVPDESNAIAASPLGKIMSDADPAKTKWPPEAAAGNGPNTMLNTFRSLFGRLDFTVSV